MYSSQSKLESLGIVSPHDNESGIAHLGDCTCGFFFSLPPSEETKTEGSEKSPQPLLASVEQNGS
jgi:hypothetical protein